MHYKVVGTAPNRKLVIEWLNMKITRNGTCTGAVGNGSFQAWLYEATHGTTPGVIQFVYGGLPAAASLDAGYSVGLQSGAANNLASVTTSVPSVSYGTANNTQLDAIAAGTAYPFTPNVPVGPDEPHVHLGGCVLDGAELERQRVQRSSAMRSTSRPTASTTPSLHADRSECDSYTATGLAASTTYYFWVYAVTEGAMSSVLSGSQATRAYPGHLLRRARWKLERTFDVGRRPCPDR